MAQPHVVGHNTVVSDVDDTRFARILLDRTPQTLSDAAEHNPLNHGDAAHAQFLIDKLQRNDVH